MALESSQDSTLKSFYQLIRVAILNEGHVLSWAASERCLTAIGVIRGIRTFICRKAFAKEYQQVQIEL